MKFFNKVKGTLDSATKKSQDAIEINKLNGQIRKHEGDMDKLLRSIGEKVLNDPALAKLETQNYVEVQVKNVHYVQSQMQTMQKKVYFLKDLIECDSCHKILPIQTKFCPDCGRNIAELAKSLAVLLACEETSE